MSELMKTLGQGNVVFTVADAAARAQAEENKKQISTLYEEIGDLQSQFEAGEETVRPQVGGYIYKDGNIFGTDDSQAYLTDFVAVGYYERIEYCAQGSAASCALAYYDEGKVFLSAVLNAGNDAGGNRILVTDDVEIPDGAVYVRMSSHGSANASRYYMRLYKSTLATEVQTLAAEVDALKSPLRGRVINALGDSITSTSYTLPVWWQIIADRTGATFNNYGDSGTEIADDETHEAQYGESFVKRCEDMDTDADAVVIMGGTNDENTPLGTWDSTDSTTFFGALDVLIRRVLTLYPGKPVLFCTMIQRAGDHPSMVLDPLAALASATATATVSMQLRAEAIKAKCRQYSVPCLDLYNDSGINSIDDNRVYFRQNDVLHPSAVGMQRIAGLVAAELEKHFYLMDAPAGDNTEDQVTYTSGVDGYVKVDGTMSTTSNAWRTDYLALDGVTRIVAQYRLADAGYALAFYDANKTLMPSVSIVGASVEQDNTIDTVPPANAAFCIFSHYVASNGGAGWVTLYS